MSHPSGVQEPEIADLWTRLSASPPGLLEEIAESRPWRNLTRDQREVFRGIVRMAITGRAARLHERT